MTAWSKLLVATTRLIDLHDSAHEPGSAFVQVSQEQRRGLRDGYWLDLGCLLLDFLLDIDFATNSAFVSQTRCLAHLREHYPDVETQSAGSTARGVELAREHPEVAAIAHPDNQGAGVELVAGDIQDRTTNTTRHTSPRRPGSSVCRRYRVAPSGRNLSCRIASDRAEAWPDV